MSYASGTNVNKPKKMREGQLSRIFYLQFTRLSDSSVSEAAP